LCRLGSFEAKLTRINHSILIRNTKEDEKNDFVMLKKEDEEDEEEKEEERGWLEHK
jgi:hypothetical protein